MSTISKKPNPFFVVGGVFEKYWTLIGKLWPWYALVCIVSVLIFVASRTLAPTNVYADIGLALAGVIITVFIAMLAGRKTAQALDYVQQGVSGSQFFVLLGKAIFFVIAIGIIGAIVSIPAGIGYHVLKQQTNPSITLAYVLAFISGLIHLYLMPAYIFFLVDLAVHKRNVFKSIGVAFCTLWGNWWRSAILFAVICFSIFLISIPSGLINGILYHICPQCMTTLMVVYAITTIVTNFFIIPVYITSWVTMFEKLKK